MLFYALFHRLDQKSEYKIPLWLGFHHYYMHTFVDTPSVASQQHILSHERKATHEKVQEEDGGKGLVHWTI